ncbi:MAG: hypothetical protein IRY99_23900 [Isosphaeraceae bacterium]|nr:hypothetical protein [Isosphaeraceae bacterium]
MPRPQPDAREVDRIEALLTVVEPGKAEAFLERCVPGSTWRARIRTAEVKATVLSRSPLGTFDERDFTCVRLRLARPVPVEPGLRFQLIADVEDGQSLAAAGMVRPWAD